MIHKTRSSVAEPETLTGAAARKETDDAIGFYAQAPNRQAPFTFKAYKADDVKNTLNRLFDGKCAYCESHYLNLAPVDVEHFRPKGAISINGKRSKPGYYWLDATWDNLLPSCIDCNRARTQVFEDEEARIAGRELRGKENKFPLTSESKRARRPEEQEREVGARLLIHPCRDHPDSHLQFLANGSVRALSNKGDASIKTYGLRRAALAESRRNRLRELARLISYIIDDLDMYARHPDDDQIQENINKKVDDLRMAGEDNEPFAGAVRQVILPFEAAMRNGTARQFAANLFQQVARVSTQ